MSATDLLDIQEVMEMGEGTLHDEERSKNNVKTFKLFKYFQPCPFQETKYCPEITMFDLFVKSSNLVPIC